MRRDAAAWDLVFDREVAVLNAEADLQDAWAPEDQRRARAMLVYANQQLRLAQFSAEAARQAAEPYYRAIGAVLRPDFQAVVDTSSIDDIL